jgi:hypothetical protein
MNSENSSCIDQAFHTNNDLNRWLYLNNIIKKKLVERAKVGHESL